MDDRTPEEMAARLTHWAGRVRAQIIAIRRGAEPGRRSNRNLRGRLGKLVAMEGDLRAVAAILRGEKADG